MKKIRGDKPIEVIIHTNMEISQGNSPCSKLKCHVFHFIFSLFFSYKIREQEGRTSPAQGGGLASMGGGRCLGKGVGGRIRYNKTCSCR
jgi:hypothetical protein